MSTNEFDRLIAKKVGQVSYEYDTSDWQKLTLQLAAARRKKRAIVFVYLSSGIAASIAIFIIFMLSEKEMPAPQQYISKQHTLPPAPYIQPANNTTNKQYAGALVSKRYKSSTVINHKKQDQSGPNIIAGAMASTAHNNPPVDTVAQQPATQQIGAFGPEQNNQKDNNEKITSLGYAEVENKPGNRGVNISLSGGVNYGTINMGYAVGAIADKKVSNRVGVEVAVAYVGNTNFMPNAMAQSSSGYPPVYGPAQPQQAVNSTLNYLQCASIADYGLTKKISLGAGADLQRLLQDHNVNVLYNDNSKIVPLIDVGMLLRIEYAISGRLKTGVSYRLGANNVISAGNNYIDRNYTQIQLKYKLH